MNKPYTPLPANIYHKLPPIIYGYIDPKFLLKIGGAYCARDKNEFRLFRHDHPAHAVCFPFITCGREEYVQETNVIVVYFDVQPETQGSKTKDEFIQSGFCYPYDFPIHNYIIQTKISFNGIETITDILFLKELETTNESI